MSFEIFSNIPLAKSGLPPNTSIILIYSLIKVNFLNLPTNSNSYVANLNTDFSVSLNLSIDQFFDNFLEII